MINQHFERLVDRYKLNKSASLIVSNSYRLIVIRYVPALHSHKVHPGKNDLFFEQPVFQSI